MRPTLPELLLRHAMRAPEAPCLSFEGDQSTYREVNERSNRVAHALRRQGVRPGDRIAVIARNAPAYYEIFFGCARAGAILVPINWRLSPDEVAAILADAGPVLILVGEDMRSLLSGLSFAPPIIGLEKDYGAWRDAESSVDPGTAIRASDAILILYTSGTTGLPKGVMISHENLSYVERTARELWAFGESSVNLVAMPLFHIGGIGYGMMALSQGGNTVLLQQPAPAAVIEVFNHHRVTHVFFVPAVIQTLVDTPGIDAVDTESLQRIIYGASPISDTLLKRAMAVFGCGFSHAYGMTETAGTVITLAPKDHDPDGPLAHRLRSCGLPAPWVELSLVDPVTGAIAGPGEIGEIRIRSRMNMLGYWGKPAETADAVTPDGWLRTGDAAYRDADGYVYIHDRYKDMIVSGGENIYPTEIENVLCHHPGVAEVAVIGVPHPRWGETPKAFVVAAANARVTEAELIAFVRSRLAHYKCPSAITFVKALPRNASGKILKRGMRDEAWLREQG